MSAHTRRACWLLLVCIGILIAGLVRSQDWTQFQKDPAKSGYTSESIPPPMNPAWTRELGNSMCSPVLWGGSLYVGAGTKLHCLDAATGVTVWEQELDSLISATPAIARGRVFAITRNGVLVSLSAHTGRRLATLRLDTMMHFSSPLVSADGSILAFAMGTPTPEIRAYETAALSPRWTFQTLQPSASSPATDGQRLVVGASDSTFYCIDLRSGEEKWRYRIPDSEVDLTTPCIDGGRVFLAVSGQSSIRALSLETGELLWTAQPQGYSGGQKASSVAAGNGRLFTVRYKLNGPSGPPFSGAPTNVVYAFEPASGSLLWTAEALATVGVPGFMPAPSLANDRVFACANTEMRVFVQSSPDPEDTDPLGGPVYSSPTPANGKVYAINKDGVLHAFQSANAAPDAPVSGFSPDGGTITLRSVPVSWNPAYDPNHDYSAIRYELYWDDDGEVLDDYDGKLLTDYGRNSATIPSTNLVPNTTVFYRVRAEDANGALSPWSLQHSFQYRPPVVSVREAEESSIPRNFKAAPSDQSVLLSWEIPRNTTASFRLSVRVEGQDGYDIPDELGLRTSYTVAGLANGVRYHFALTAVEADGKESPAAFASATPSPQIVLRTADGRVLNFSASQLRKAAETAGPGDRIELGENRYVIDGPLELTHGVTLEGLSPSKTVIDGSAMPRKDKLQEKGALRIHGGPSTSADKRPAAEPTRIGRLSILHAPDYAVEAGPQSSVELVNLVLARCGAGILAEKGASGLARNLTIANNGADGIFSRTTDLTLRNLILSGNGGTAVKLDLKKEEGALQTTYSLFYDNSGGTHAGGATSGIGDSSGNPSFVDPGTDDYHLAGGSFAIDAGDPADDASAEPQPNGNRIDQGAYGGTSEAALSGASSGQATAGSGASPTQGKAAGAGGSGGGCFISR